MIVTQTYDIFPNLLGLGFDVNKTPQWNANVNMSFSGKKTAINFWSYPVTRYELTYDYLPSDLTAHDLQDLMGFFNSMNGRASPFLFTDADDYSVTGQLLGLGDGASVDFQLVSAYGGFTQPILAPNDVSNVYIGTAAQASSLWTVSAYGTSAPGVLTFTGAPSSGAQVSADFTYYWPVRFLDDILTFRKFMDKIWDAKKVMFETEK